MECGTSLGGRSHTSGDLDSDSNASRDFRSSFLVLAEDGGPRKYFARALKLTSFDFRFFPIRNDGSWTELTARCFEETSGFERGNFPRTIFRLRYVRNVTQATVERRQARRKQNSLDASSLGRFRRGGPSAGVRNSKILRGKLAARHARQNTLHQRGASPHGGVDERRSSRLRDGFSPSRAQCCESSLRPSLRDETLFKKEIPPWNLTSTPKVARQ